MHVHIVYISNSSDSTASLSALSPHEEIPNPEDEELISGADCHCPAECEETIYFQVDWSVFRLLNTSTKQTFLSNMKVEPFSTHNIPTNIAIMNVVCGCPNASSGVRIVEQKRH